MDRTFCVLFMMGVVVLGGLPILAETRYVDVNSVSPQSPFTNWGIAATNIQTAIDAAVIGDEVLVAPGRYMLSGARVRIPPDKRLYLKSMESRAAIVDAQWQSHCLDVVGTNSVVEGFVFCHGSNDNYGVAWSFPEAA